MSRHRYTDEELIRSIKWYVWHHQYGCSLTAILKYAGSSRERIKRLIDTIPEIDSFHRDVRETWRGKVYKWNWNYSNPDRVDDLDQEEDQLLDPPGYAARVRELEAEGLTTSDAQGVADVEFGL